MPIPVQHPARPRPRPNYASRAETLKVAEEVVREDREVFRRLADA